MGESKKGEETVKGSTRGEVQAGVSGNVEVGQGEEVMGLRGREVKTLRERVAINRTKETTLGGRGLAKKEGQDKSIVFSRFKGREVGRQGAKERFSSKLGGWRQIKTTGFGRVTTERGKAYHLLGEEEGDQARRSEKGSNP